jgi:SulP family sulfate permease
VPADFFAQVHAIATHLGGFNPYAFALGALCLAGLFVWPRLFVKGSPLTGRMLEGATVRIAARTPGPIVALVTLSLATAWLALPVETDWHPLRRHSARPADIRLARCELAECSAALHSDA